MNKKLIAIILAAVVLLSVVGVGIFLYFNKEPADDMSYTSVEISAADIVFDRYSNKPNIKLTLSDEMLTEAFGVNPTEFEFRKADRIRVHFSDGRKFEIKPNDEGVKITENDGTRSIKIYSEDKDLFESVDKVLRFDTSCSVKVFFDEGTFELDGNKSRAVTLTLKFDSNIVSNAHEVYMKAIYENYVLKLSMTDAKGADVLFTTSGNTSESLLVYTDKENKHIFNPDIIITDLFKTALVNPSEMLPADKTISIYVPTGYFVNSDGNRIKVVGLKDSDENIRLATEEDVEETTSQQQETVTDETTVELTQTDGVVATPVFENEFEDATGEMYRNLTDVELLVPTDADLENANIEATIQSSTESYIIPSSSITCLKSGVAGGYTISVSLRSSESCEIGGIVMDGILYNENDFYDVELKVTAEDGSEIAKISCPIG